MDRKSKSERCAYAEAIKSLYGDGSIRVSGSARVKRRSRRVSESESDSQVRLVLWLDEMEVPFYSVPNGADVSPSNRARLVREGLSAGVPDLCIPIARRGYHGAYIELKREDGRGLTSESQKKWLAVLAEEGYFAEICTGFEQAKERIRWYLDDEV